MLSEASETMNYVYYICKSGRHQVHFWCSAAAPQKMYLFDLSGKDYLSPLLPSSIIFNFVIIFLKKFLSYHTCMYQLYSSGSNRCAEFSKSWNKIGMLFDHKLRVRCTMVLNVPYSFHFINRT